MRAISGVRTSRTVIEATTSSRLSFSLTLLRKMSPIRTARPPASVPACRPLSAVPCSRSLGLIDAPALCCRREAGVSRRRAGTETIHELHDRLQVDPRPGLGRGMAGARRSRRLLPPGRQIRHDRPHLQPHHGAYSRERGPPAHQPLRHALQGDHGLEPGEDRRGGRDRLEARYRLRHQQIGLRDPRRDPQGTARRRLRAPHPHPRRHRGVGDEVRAVAAVADLDPLRRPYRLPRLRGARGRSRRARAHRRRPRSARCTDHAQSRPAHLRGDHPAGVQHHVSARIVVPLAGRCHGGARRARYAGGERARAHRASLPARHPPSLRRAGMARDAAPARGRGPQLRLPALLALMSVHPIPTTLTFPYPTPPEPGRPIEIAPGILWVRLALPFRLDHVNVYLIEDGAGWAVVDTGIDDAPTRATWDALLAGPLAARPLTRVLVTHYHPDHMGLAGWLCGRFGLPLLMSQTEYLVSLNIHLDPGALNAEPYLSFYRSHGLDDGTTERLLTGGHRYLRMISGLPRTFRRLIAGELLQIGGRTFEVLTGGGHAPEQVMLFCPAENLFLCADQVLARISPNISVQAMDPEGDPLGIYLRSLASLKRDLPEDVLVLPGHNLPFVGLRARIDELCAD